MVPLINFDIDCIERIDFMIKVICVAVMTANMAWCVPVNLMGLLKWRENPKELESYLRRFMEVDGEEIVKVRARIRFWKSIKTVLGFVYQ